MITQINKQPKGSPHGWEKRKEGAKQRKRSLHTHLPQSGTRHRQHIKHSSPTFAEG